MPNDVFCHFFYSLHEMAKHFLRFTQNVKTLKLQVTGNIVKVTIRNVLLFEILLELTKISFSHILLRWTH